MSDQPGNASLDRWKQTLLDPSDRLLDMGEHGVPIAIDPIRVAFALAGGASFAFEPSSEPGFESGRLKIALGATELEQRLAMLRRAARAADGEHVLWLALGLVTWNDGDGQTRVAPLALWPVAFAMEGGAARLVAARELRPRVNDLLLEGLRRGHDLQLEVSDPLDLGALFDAIAEFAREREGWRVERVARLATFSFARFDLWRDLDTLGDSVLGSLPVEWLAGLLTPPATLRTSGEVIAPLDADAGQLAAIAAAGAGGSFVLHGPPGTGKSQTIANLVMHCASQGKSVLVVSDRASALDVIQQRLGTIGFPDLCLALHAGHGARERVLGALVRVLDKAFRPGSTTTAAESRLATLRAGLDGYVNALHRVGPLGMSIHDVLGRLVELRTTPRAALAERDSAALDRPTFETRRAAVEKLAHAALAVEPVATHPWRTSALETWSPDTSSERATRALNEVASTVETLVSAIADVGKLVPGIVARKPDQLRALGALAELAAASPRPGAELLTNMRGARNDEIGERIALIRARGGGTLEVPRDPSAFLAIATRHRALLNEVDDVFTESINDTDAGELWSQLKRWTASMAALRYVALRNARAEVKAAAQVGQLHTDDAMISALEAVIAERACRTALLGAAEPALRWFGDLGGDALSLDLTKIEEAVGWGAELRRAFDLVTIGGGEAGRQAAWRALVAQVSASPGQERAGVELAPFARLASAVGHWEPALAELGNATGISKEMLGLGNDHLAALRDQVETLHRAVGSLAEWTAFHHARHAARIAGVGPAIAAIERGDLTAAELAPAWQRAILLAWIELEIAETPALAKFNGVAHHSAVASFTDLDRGSLSLTRARATARIAERVPRNKNGDPEVAVLRSELDQPHGRALRAVLADIPTLLGRLAPCVLATPHAIAQHLAGTLPAFDLVVFDEASRLPAAHAFGALARAKAAVIVGDLRQPSPPDGSEGLLALALASKLPALSLGVHYRSRHEDLIAFASRRYYGDRLEVLPAPFPSPDLGISWRRVDGAADHAGANRCEAEAIVADLRARLADPLQRVRSFAVVTFSRAQQDLVEDILDAACLADAELAKTLAGMTEPLLVGTPDRLQGEERDVVLVSFADAGDSLGALAHPGGERWLNVAITRAREQLVLVSSFAPEDILSEAPTARDLAALLAFARAGGGAAKIIDDALPATPITAAIARALVERGWPVRHRIGCGPYQLDLVVVDPNDPERFVLAIEHDGAAYASSTSARSRDRLRAQLLAQLGWRTHRVWSLDWWLDPEREIQRAHGAIVAAVAASRQKRNSIAPPARRDSSAPPIARRARGTASPSASGSAPTHGSASRTAGGSAPNLAAGSAPTLAGVSGPHLLPKAVVLDDTARLAAPELDSLRTASQLDENAVKRDETTPVNTGGAPVLAAGSGPTDMVAALPVDLASSPIRLPRGAITIGPYTAAAVPAGRRAPDDMFAPRYLGELGKCIEQVLAAEAPIHLDLLARRCAAYFGIGRVSAREVDQIRSALEGRGKLGPEQNIVWRVDQDPAGVPPVRVAGQSASARRDIAEVPLSEVAAAARIVVERANGMASTDLVRDCARLLGFARITEVVTERVSMGIRLATARQLISIDAGKAHLLLDG